MEPTAIPEISPTRFDLSDAVGIRAHLQEQGFACVRGCRPDEIAEGTLEKALQLNLAGRQDTVGEVFPRIRAFAEAAPEVQKLIDRPLPEPPRADWAWPASTVVARRLAGLGPGDLEHEPPRGRFINIFSESRSEPPPPEALPAPERTAPRRARAPARDPNPEGAGRPRDGSAAAAAPPGASKERQRRPTSAPAPAAPRSRWRTTDRARVGNGAK